MQMPEEGGGSKEVKEEEGGGKGKEEGNGGGRKKQNYRLMQMYLIHSLLLHPVLPSEALGCVGLRLVLREVRLILPPDSTLERGREGGRERGRERGRSIANRSVFEECMTNPRAAIRDREGRRVLASFPGFTRAFTHTQTRKCIKAWERS